MATRSQSDSFSYPRPAAITRPASPKGGAVGELADELEVVAARAVAAVGAGQALRDDFLAIELKYYGPHARYYTAEDLAPFVDRWPGGLSARPEAM